MAVSVGIGRYVKCGCSKALPFLDGERGYIHTFFVECSHSSDCGGFSFNL